jgi:uncharacterized protein (TIGR02594 family)
MSGSLQRGLSLGSLLAVCFFSLAAMTTIADARPAKRSLYLPPGGDTEFAHLRSDYAAWGRAVSRPRPARVAAIDSSAKVGTPASSLISEARRWIGTNPTGRSRLWCGDFMNFVLQRTGHRTINSSTARAFAAYGKPLSGPQVGAIAVMTRGATGGHVGIVTGFDPDGNPIIISGNVNGRVEEIPFPRRIIFAYVTP